MGNGVETDFPLGLHVMVIVLIPDSWVDRATARTAQLWLLGLEWLRPKGINTM